MGVTKRSLSPPAHCFADASDEDILYPTYLVGQVDIRSYCITRTGCHLGEGRLSSLTVNRSKKLRDSTNVPSCVEGAVLPLVKLPGQTDIRSFLHDSWDEEAAKKMGLSFGLEQDDEDADELNITAAEIQEANQMRHDWSKAWDAAEEAAVSMGLSLGMQEDIEDFLEDMANEILQSSVRLDLCATDNADRYTSDEQAAREEGLSFSIDDDGNDTGHVDKRARLEDYPLPSPAPATPKRSAAKDDKETPPQNSKKRRVENSLLNTSDFKSASGKCAVAVTDLEEEAKGEVGC